MEMKGQYRILSSRRAVWDALNDAAILKNCLRGCERFDKSSDSSFDVVFTAKVGPIKTTFCALIALTNINPPESYTLSGEGKGGAAGFAKGSANVQLTESQDATVLVYTVSASLKGKIGQMGARVVDETAKNMADDFFGRFTEIVSAQSQSEKVSPVATDSSTTDKSRPKILWYLLAAAILAGAAVAAWLR
jgi:uncharacterized protein